MENYYWTDWYAGWGWFLWFGLILVMFSSFGNWGYTYRTHRRFNGSSKKNAIDFLNERYARGEIKHEEYLRMKVHILGDGSLASSSTSLNKEILNRDKKSPKPSDRPTDHH